MKKITALIMTALFITFSLGALDYGLILNQNVEVSGLKDPQYGYTANLDPHFSFLFGDSGDLFLSARLTYNNGESVYIVPELLRTELSWRISRLKLSIGRMQYTAPFEHVADGLFDGFQFSGDSPVGTLYSGVWYTGLLYKRSANIVMNADDLNAYSAALDYGDFFNTYFASRRFIATIGWEHPGIAQIVRAKFSVIQQSDLNDRDEYLSCHYFTAKISVPIKNLYFELGGVYQVTESANDSNAGLTWEFGAFWNLPLNLPSQLSFTAYFSKSKGGGSNSQLPVFTPITAYSIGEVAGVYPSEIASFNIGFSTKLQSALSFSLNTLYLMRYFAEEDDVYRFFLENEIYAKIIWNPVSDLHLSLGGGIFIPSRWAIKFNAVLTLL